MVEFKESDSGQYVRYTGTSNERVISKEDWKGVGLTHDTVVWSKDNAFHVPVEDISEDAWPYIEQDADLKLAKVDDVAKLRAQAVAGPGASVHPLAAARVAKQEEQTAAAANPGGSLAGGTGSVTTTGGSTAGGRGAR